EDNVISGNGTAAGAGDGVEISGSLATGNVVQGNEIGTDATGLNDVGNSGAGVLITGDASGNTIGGGTAARNIISGNDSDGIQIFRANLNFVYGNYIGLKATGSTELGNSGNGIAFVTAMTNTIGSPTSGFGNFISGNGISGVDIDSNSAGNIIQGNTVGADTLTGNIHFGIRVEGNDNTIGGVVAGVGNSIHHNGFTSLEAGVLITGTVAIGNQILGNSIANNGGLGIALAGGGNNNQASQTISSASQGSTRVIGTMSGTAFHTYRLEFFSNTVCDSSGTGEGATFIGAQNVTTDGSGNASYDFTFPSNAGIGAFITGTATDMTPTFPRNTSAFSPCRVVIPA